MRTVPLSGPRSEGRVALVDDGDCALVTAYCWNVLEEVRRGRNRGPYAVSRSGHGRGNRKSLLMHNLIMGSVGIDHVNHDGLNNQRHNLRPASNGQNHANMRPRVGGTSAYKGVSWHPARGKWTAGIKVNYKRRYLGLFVSEVDAARAYDAAAREAWGEYACLNFPAAA